MRKLLYILPVILILGFAACENYVDISPTGKKTVDSTDTYYELIALPNRAYHPAAFALLSDNVWSKESNIIGNEFISWDGINMTFNEAANRKELSDNNLYENCYTYILRSNIVISLVDASLGDKDVKELAKAEAKIMRAWDHFILINTFAKAYNPETAATDGGVAIIDKYDLEATPTKSTVAQVYDFIIKELWGPRASGDNQILRVNMANIRRKIEKNPAEPEYLFTEVGVGYRMAESET